MPAAPLSTAVPHSRSSSKEEAVRVVIQTRPLLPFETAQGAVQSLFAQSDPPCVSVRRTNGAPDATFTSFDAVYPPIPDLLPDALYQTHVVPLLTSVFSGVNATVFAYGQTSAGKSYTMRHITSCVAHHLFQHKNQIERQNSVHISIRVSFVEVYKDVIRDLVDGASAPLATVHVNVRERVTPAGRVVFLDGAKERVVESQHDLLAIIKEASLVRRTAATGMNASSSRSHSIITLSVIQEPLEDPNDPATTLPSQSKPISKVLSAKLHLVDLAGSERAKRTAAAGERFAEGVQINRGLFALAKVISVLAENAGKPKSKHRHVPYRDSKLTRLLQDSLGGNARTLLIACVSPADSSVEESLGTLRYAQRARRICNKPTVNTDPTAVEVSDLRAALSRARAQISALVTDNERLRAQLGLTPRRCLQRRTSHTSPTPADRSIPQTPGLQALQRTLLPNPSLIIDDTEENNISDLQTSHPTSTNLSSKSLLQFSSHDVARNPHRAQFPLAPRIENPPQNPEMSAITSTHADGEENNCTERSAAADNVRNNPQQKLGGVTTRSVHAAEVADPKRSFSSRMPLRRAFHVRPEHPVSSATVRRRARSAAPLRRVCAVVNSNRSSKGVNPPTEETKKRLPVRAIVHQSAQQNGKFGHQDKSPKRKGRQAGRSDEESATESGDYEADGDSEDENDAYGNVNENAGLGRSVASALSEARVEQMRRTFTERLEQAENDKSALDKERSRLLQEISTLREKHAHEIKELTSSHVSKLAAVRAKLAGVKRLEAETTRQTKMLEGSDAARKHMQGRVIAAEKAKEQVVERMSDALARANLTKRNLSRENRDLAKAERSLRHEVQKLVDAMARVETTNAKLRMDNDILRGRLRDVVRDSGIRRTNSAVPSSIPTRTVAM